ncbi:Yip1 member 1 [Bulinus truncatus]|nr:Yip1 member 1 [Bulinus truncatus]
MATTTVDVAGLEKDDKQDKNLDLLKFQDIPHEISGNDQTHQFTDFPHSAADSDDEESDSAKLLKEKSSLSFWTFAYYQQFFNVDTQQVGKRILASVVPRPGKNYLIKHIRPNPDLYGPFWICTTLVFTTAIAGNMANYFSAAGTHYKWKYDFHKVTFAATAIFSYWWIIPLLLYGVLWWRGSQAKFTFLEMICVYGYSLVIYIPISILWVIQVSWLQWTLVVVGAVLSGSVLLLTFWPAVSEDNKKIAVGLMTFIFIMHAALAAGFVLYFFYVPSTSSDQPSFNITVALTPIGLNTSTPADGPDDKQDKNLDLLKFQDIPHEISGNDQTHQFTDFPHSAADSDDEESDSAKLLKEKSSLSFWTFAYYQQFFNVDTQQVGKRILASVVPRPGKNYLIKHIRPNPDLYGPFWICTTLVFTTAIAGNMANYFSAAGTHYKWKYDFHKVTFAATAIFSYWWIIPLLLYGVLWWRGSQAKFTFLEMICVYGYSLVIYIPISILWVIQVSWLQWTLVVVGAVLSGSVLLLTFWPAVSEDNKKIAVGLMTFIFIMHAALAAGFVLYFFYVPSTSSDQPSVNTTVALTPIGLNTSTMANGPLKYALGWKMNKTYKRLIRHYTCKSSWTVVKSCVESNG